MTSASPDGLGLAPEPEDERSLRLDRPLGVARFRRVRMSSSGLNFDVDRIASIRVRDATLRRYTTMSQLTPPTDRGRGSDRAGESRDDADVTPGVAEGLPTPARRDQGVTHRLRIDPSRSMKAITGEVETLLGDLEEGRRRSGALLASELIGLLLTSGKSLQTTHSSLTGEPTGRHPHANP